MDAEQLRPLGVGEILDAALKIYRSRFATLVKAVGLVVAPVQTLGFLVRISLPTSSPTTTTLSGSSSASQTTASTSASWAATLVVIALTLVGSALAEAAALRIVGDQYLGTHTEWKDSLRFGFARLGALLWLTVLRAVALLAALAACVVPGVWLYTAWAVAVPALLVERAAAAQALGRSYRLVRGRWWPTFGALLLALLLVTVVTSVFSIVLVPLLVSGASSTVRIAASAGVAAITGVLTTPFTVAVVTVVYFDLRVRKEGFDLALMARRVGAAPAAPPGPPPGARVGSPPTTPPPITPPPTTPPHTPAPERPPWAPPERPPWDT